MLVVTFAVHGQRNGALLHRGGLGVTQVLDSLHQLGRQAQFNETIGLIGHSGIRAVFRQHGLGSVFVQFRGIHAEVLGFSVNNVLRRRGFALQMDILRHFEK